MMVHFAGDRGCISSLLELFLAKGFDSVFTSIWINARFTGHQGTILSLNFLRTEIPIHRFTDGLELLGSPAYWSDILFHSTVAKNIDKFRHI